MFACPPARPSLPATLRVTSPAGPLFGSHTLGPISAGSHARGAPGVGVVTSRRGSPAVRPFPMLLSGKAAPPRTRAGMFGLETNVS